MLRIRHQELKKLAPSYGPASYLPDTWEGTALDLLKAPDVSLHDAVWAIAHLKCAPDVTLRKFACWCAAEELVEYQNTDDLAWDALELGLNIDPQDPEETQATRRALLGHGFERPWWYLVDDAGFAALAYTYADSLPVVNDAKKRKLIALLTDAEDFTKLDVYNMRKAAEGER